MKQITLSNPERAKQILTDHHWGDIFSSFIEVENNSWQLMLNAGFVNPSLIGSKLQVSLGDYMVFIELGEEYGDQIQLDLKIIGVSGILLTINKAPCYLKVTKPISDTALVKITKAFNELKFLSIRGDNVTDLSPLSRLSALTSLKLISCKNVRDLTPLSGLSALTELFYSAEYLTDLSPLFRLTTLTRLRLTVSKFIDLSPLSELSALSELVLYCRRDETDLSLKSRPDVLRDLNYTNRINFLNLSPLSGLSALTSLDLKSFKNLKDLSPLSGLSALTSLDLSGCESLTDLSPLSGLSELTILNLSWCKNVTDLSPLSELSGLTSLDLSGCKNLTDLSALSELSSLNGLGFSSCNNVRDLSPLSKLSGLTRLYLSGCHNVRDISPLSELSSLSELDLSLTNVTDLSPLSGLSGLTRLYLNHCKNVRDLSPIYELSALTSLNLGGCDNLTHLTSICRLNALRELHLSGCTKLTRIKNIQNLKGLRSVNLEDCPNVRDFEHLATLTNLRELRWIDPVACSLVLMKVAVNRKDTLFINEKVSSWIETLTLSKDANEFTLHLLNSLELLEKGAAVAHLAHLSEVMRERGLQSEVGNDLNAYTWENWCNQVCTLEKQTAISILHAPVNNLNIIRETDSILGPVILADSLLIHKYPEEKSNILNWVNGQLFQLESYSKEQQQIAPSAAVFFASLNQKDEVLFWLQKATDKKAPLWRERVLHALVKHYAKKENFTEARRLLEEMHIQEEKDYAIAALAQAMAASHPVEAGFLLDEINELNISSEAAHKMLHQPAMLSAPQGLYQLLLHLQSNPDELASALEMIIERDTIGSTSEAVKQLFIQTQASGPSAAVLLEWCQHPAVAQFVKAWKLEELMIELAEASMEEKRNHTHHFIDLLEHKNLIDPEERAMITAKLRN